MAKPCAYSIHCNVSFCIAFTLNGELLQGSFESTIAFENINTSNGLMPAITLSAGQRAQLNFGKSEVSKMKSRLLKWSTHM